MHQNRQQQKGIALDFWKSLAKIEIPDSRKKQQQ